MATIKRREGTSGISYLIRTSCGYDASGKQVMRSMTWKPAQGMSERQIQKELQRQAVLFDEKCAAQGVGGGNIKFEVFARQWLEEYAKPQLRPRTVARLYQLQDRIYAGIGHIRLDKLNARHIQSFINNLNEEGVSLKGAKATLKIDMVAHLHTQNMNRKEFAEKAGVSRSIVSSVCKGESTTISTAEKIAKALGKEVKALFNVEKSSGKLSPKTIQHYLSFISSVMDYALHMGIVAVNPCKQVVLPSSAKVERECYTLDEAQHFLDSLDAAPTKYRAFFILAIYGGFRRGELLGLEWRDIDFDGQIIHVQRTSQYLKERGTFTDETKTEGSRRTLKLPTVVFDVLRQHRAEQAEERLKMGDRWQDTGRLFVHQDGTPMHPNTPYHWLKRFCESTGQRFLGIHAFRHLNASLLINSGVDAKTVSSSLGHSQVTTTLNIYAHTFAEAQARASEAVADLLNKKTGTA